MYAYLCDRMEKVSFIPQLAWINSGFGAMRTIRDYIQTCESRFDPTVIPLGKPLAEENQMPDPQTLNTTILWQKNPDNKYYSAEDYHSMYKSGELTPLAVVKAILPLIRRDITPPGEYSIGLFDTNVDLVLKTAEESTKRYQKKGPLGIFDGVPTGIKDEFDLDGYKTSHGSPVDFTGIGITEGSITAWNARKLQEAGAIIMGKLSMHEFGLGASFPFLQICSIPTIQIQLEPTSFTERRRTHIILATTPVVVLLVALMLSVPALSQWL